MTTQQQDSALKHEWRVCVVALSVISEPVMNKIHYAIHAS